MAILSKLVLATAGTLPHDTSQIKKWIEVNGGTYTSTATKHTTHLIASKEAYKKPHPAVQRASDLGIRIVSFDWFDDSLQARRKLSEKKYTWESLRKEKRKRKEVKRLGELSDGKK
ncbi:BRCT domain-containing protein, partial [Plenodomus tracheiphilus IPT5]